MIPRSEVTLRRALPEDAPTIAEIWHLGWRDGHLGFVSQELIAARHEDSFRTRVCSSTLRQVTTVQSLCLLIDM